MPDEVDVGRPGKVLRILRASDQEAQILPQKGWRDEQTLECALTIAGISAEIGQGGTVVRLWRSRPVDIGVCVAVERFDSARACQAMEIGESGRAAREAQHEIEALQAVG